MLSKKGFVILLSLSFVLPGMSAAGQGQPGLIVPASVDAPENSLAAFRNAWRARKNIAGVSTYVRRTADGVLVCCQDADVKRLTGVSMEIRKSKYSELRKLDFASYAEKPEWKGTEITRFDDVLKEMPRSGKLFVEVAYYDEERDFHDAKFLKTFAEAVERSGIDQSGIVIVSASPRALRKIRSEYPELKTLFYNRLGKHDRKDYRTADFRSVQEKLRTYGFHGTALSLEKTDLAPEEVALLRERGQKICIWENFERDPEKLACIAADLIRTSDIAGFEGRLPEIARKRAQFRGPAKKYDLVLPYDPAKLPPAPPNGRNTNPYAGVDWNSVQQIHTTSHAHCPRGDSVARWLKLQPNPMKFLTLSNYHPAAPTYPYNVVNHENYFILNHRHEQVRNGKIVKGPFDWNRIISEWEGELSPAARKNFPFKLGGPVRFPKELPPGIPEAPNAEYSHFTDSSRHICSPGSMYASGNFDVKNNYLLRKHGFAVGTGQPILTVFRKILNELLVPDGGGITVNHPHYPVSAACTVPELVRYLDFDHRVLGMEIFNLGCVEGEVPSCGWADDLWDRVLATGRQCYAFSVPDWQNWRGGHNVLLVEKLTQEECLKAYRQGRFYCAVWGQSIRFTGISYKDGVFRAETDRPAELRIISAQGVVVRKENASEISLDMRGRDGKKDVFLRVEVRDETGEQLFSQAVIL